MVLHRSRHAYPIAIDIGTRYVKVLQLANDSGQLQVLAADKFEVPIRLRRESERQELIADRLQDVLKNSGFVGRRVLTTVPNTSIKYKSFRIPPMPTEELNQVVKFEAHERFAFTEPNAEYRYLRAGEVRQGHETREEIIAMGCPAEPLKAQLEMLDQLGLVCDAVEAAPCAIADSYIAKHGQSDADAAHVLVDIGFHTSRIVIARGGRIIFIKAIAVGGSKFDELTAKTLNLSSMESAQLRHEVLSQYASGPAEGKNTVQGEIIDSALEAVRPAVEQLGKEIGLCLRYYSVTFRGIRPELLSCVGGESYNPHLLRTLTEITGIEATSGQVFENIATAGAFSAAQRRGGLLEWATAAGLATRPWTLNVPQKAAS